MIDDGQLRFTVRGKPVYHFIGRSTFSEYTVVHIGCVAKINPEALLDKGCVLHREKSMEGNRRLSGLSMSSDRILNWVWRDGECHKDGQGLHRCHLRPGAVGLAAMEGTRISGASRIIGIDMIPSKFEQAKKFGCTDFVNPKDYDKPVQEVIVEMTNGGMDRSVECTGNTSAMISTFECVHDGWGVVGKDATFKTHPMNFLNERTLKGTFFGNYNSTSRAPPARRRRDVHEQGAGGGEVHHAQSALLGDRHGLRPHAQGGEPSLHHQDAGVASQIYRPPRGLVVAVLSVASRAINPRRPCEHRKKPTE